MQEKVRRHGGGVKQGGKEARNRALKQTIGLQSMADKLADACELVRM